MVWVCLYMYICTCTCTYVHVHMYMYMCGVHVLCMVSMCCVWCPCVLLSVSIHHSSSSGLTSQELCSTPQHDLRTILLFIHPLAIFPTTFDLVQWLAASHNHIPTQNSTIFTHIEWEPVLWQRPIDGPPPTPCDTPTVRKALLGLKSHRRWISTKTNFILMELQIENTWKHTPLQVLVLTCTQSCRLLCHHIYMYMLNVGSTTSTHLH